MIVSPGRRSLLVALGQLGLFGAALTAVVIALLPAAVESAGFFTVAEALTNAVKHAEAARPHRGRATRGDRDPGGAAYDLLGLAAGGEDHRHVLAVVRYLSR